MLQVSIKEENGDPVANSRIAVHIEGSRGDHLHTAVSGTDGLAQIDFEMPKITGAEPAMVIRAEESHGKGQLRFSLRAKPRVPVHG